MTIKQILTNVNRIPEFDLTRPVTNPLLRVACGYILGIAVFGLGSMMIGITPSDRAIRLLALALGIVVALNPNTPSLKRGESANTEGSAL